MPKSNNPYDLINALEEKYSELAGEEVFTSTNITAADDDVDLLDEYIGDTDAEFDTLADETVKYNIATDDEIALVGSVAGWTVENLNKIIRARTGYDDIETYLGEVYPE